MQSRLFATPKIFGTARNRAKLLILEALCIDKLKPGINIDKLLIFLYFLHSLFQKQDEHKLMSTTRHFFKHGHSHAAAEFAMARESNLYPCEF